MRVLVTAASRHGSAAEIAEIVGGLLRDAGVAADVRRPDAVDSLAEYDAVILGSGVYAGHWLQPAKAFVARHATALRARRVHLFSCGPLGDPPRPAEDPVDVAGIIDATGAVDHRVFPGRLVKSELGFAEKLLVAGVRAPYGDFRPWDDIVGWVQAIAGSLRAGEVPAAAR